MIALLEAKAAGLWSRSQIRNNVLAGLVVGIVALPLAMAFAIASGARPEQGLYTAIVAALLTSIFGGTRVQISGPTGAFVAVLSIITAQHGIAGLQIATLMAGVILLVFGFARLGAVIKYIPNPVIAGFTAGIAVIIFVGQWKDFFGLSPAPAGLHFHAKLWSLIEALPTISPATTGLALLALAILTLGPRYLKRIPAPLIALLVVTVAAGRFSIQGGRDHWFRLRRNPAHTARVVAALAGAGASPILGGPGVHHRLAGRDRIAVVRRGGGRHGRHPS